MGTSLAILQKDVLLIGQAQEALALLDEAAAMVQPDAATLCLRGRCCSALGNNALVRMPCLRFGTLITGISLSSCTPLYIQAGVPAHNR